MRVVVPVLGNPITAKSKSLSLKSVSSRSWRPCDVRKTFFATVVDWSSKPSRNKDPIMVGWKIISGCKTNKIAVRMENVPAKRRKLAMDDVSFAVAIPCFDAQAQTGKRLCILFFVTLLYTMGNVSFFIIQSKIARRREEEKEWFGML